MRRPSVEQQTPTSHCTRCLKALAPGNRVVVAWITKHVPRRMASFREILQNLAKNDFELAHARCFDPHLTLAGGDVSTYQRVGMDTCGACRKKIEITHRVCAAYIVDGVGPNPEMPFSGAVARLNGQQGEYVHIDCNDPALTNPIVSRPA